MLGDRLKPQKSQLSSVQMILFDTLKSNIRFVLILLFYLICVVWAFAISVIWLKARPNIYWHGRTTYEPSFINENLEVYPIILLVFVPVELFLTIITLIIYFCCHNQYAFKTFICSTIFFSIAVIVVIAAAISGTTAPYCLTIYDFPFYNFKNRAIGACFESHANNACLLPFYIISHLFFILYLITHYEQEDHKISTATLNENKENLYEQQSYSK